MLQNGERNRRKSISSTRSSQTVSYTPNIWFRSFPFSCEPFCPEEYTLFLHSDACKVHFAIVIAIS